jgi:hypothetical protein
MFQRRPINAADGAQPGRAPALPAAWPGTPRSATDGGPGPPLPRYDVPAGSGHRAGQRRSWGRIEGLSRRAIVARPRPGRGASRPAGPRQRRSGRLRPHQPPVKQLRLGRAAVPPWAAALAMLDASPEAIRILLEEVRLS